MDENMKNNNGEESLGEINGWYSDAADFVAEEEVKEIPSETVTAVPEIEKSAHEKKKSGLTAGKIIALVLACLILSTAAGAGGALLVNNFGKSADAEQAPLPAEEKNSAEESHAVSTAANEKASLETLTGSDAQAMTAAEIYKRNVSSTVGITTEITTNYWGYTSTSPASGSGFIISSDGFVVTNFHVVENSSRVSVTLYDGTSYDAAVVGFDESNDIAVLKVKAEGLDSVVLGSSDALSVGQDVIAIGNPLGELSFSLTKGVVSALDRDITLQSGITMKLIQTDCSINSGNSGGALFNMRGEVIGITNAKYSSGSRSGAASIDNIGFAIPIDSVRDIVAEIVANGVSTKPYIGVSVITVGADGISYPVEAGAVIKTITEGSPADIAGIELGDIVTAVDGKEIASSDELVEIIKETHSGEAHVFSVYRKGENIRIEVIIGETMQSVSPVSSNSSQTETATEGFNPFDMWPFSFGFGN